MYFENLLYPRAKGETYNFYCTFEAEVPFLEGVKKSTKLEGILDLRLKGTAVFTGNKEASRSYSELL